MFEIMDNLNKNQLKLHILFTLYFGTESLDIQLLNTVCRTERGIYVIFSSDGI